MTEPYFYPRLIEPPIPSNYDDEVSYRSAFDMWLRTGGYNSYIPNLIGLKASVPELNTLVGVDIGTTVQAQLNLKQNIATLGSMAFQNANAVAVTGGSLTNCTISASNITGGIISQATINNSVNVPEGTSGSFGRAIGSVYRNGTQVFNTNTSFTDLMSYTLPANSLIDPNDTIEIEAGGVFAPGSGSRRLDLHFGSSLIYSTGSVTPGDSSWYVKGIIMRNGANSQRSFVQMICSNTAAISLRATSLGLAENMNSNLLIKFIAEASDGAQKVYQDFMTIKWMGG